MTAAEYNSAMNRAIAGAWICAAGAGALALIPVWPSVIILGLGSMIFVGVMISIAIEYAGRDR